LEFLSSISVFFFFLVATQGIVLNK
jgi:hypothetical protein